MPQADGGYVVDQEWDIAVGESLLRKELHQRFGDASQGGMEPSGKTANVFLFTEKSAGDRFGYKFDGWHSDGTFHYTGEGQIGDQVMTFGNRAARDHTVEGRALRLFRAEGTKVTYVGEFTLPTEVPYFYDEAPDREGNLRRVIVFRLESADDVAPGMADIRAPAAGKVAKISLEANNVDKYERQHPEEPPTVIRREAALVARYASWLTAQGQESTRHKVPTAAGRHMYTDIYNKVTNELIEAKASSSRTYVRVGLGQILDYARFVAHERKALLLASEPTDDLIELLLSYPTSPAFGRPTRTSSVAATPVVDVKAMNRYDEAGLRAACRPQPATSGWWRAAAAAIR